MAMPNYRLTACGSNWLRCPTMTAPIPSLREIAKVLLQTTRTKVNCAVVAGVPSQAVASSR